MGNASGLSSEDFGKLILRFAVGGLLLFHGISKLMHGISWMMPMLAKAGLPAALAYGVYVGEVVAPVLIIVGLWTRPAALIVAIDLLMAIALVQRDKILTVSEMSGGWSIELEAFYVLAALALMFMGGGRCGFGQGKGRLN